LKKHVKLIYTAPERGRREGRVGRRDRRVGC
jgi:hypothetical protein